MRCGGGKTRPNGQTGLIGVVSYELRVSRFGFHVTRNSKPETIYFNVMFKLSPTTSLLLQRGIQRGLSTLKRERGWGTSLWALVGVMLLVQLFLVLCIGVQGIDQLLRTQTDLRLQTHIGATDRGIQEFIAAAQTLPEVSHVEYITREQAFERERRANPDLVMFLEQFKIENPFPDTIAVTLKSFSSYDHFTAFVRQEQWQKVIDPAFLSQTTGQEGELRKMLRLTNAGWSLSFLVLSLTGIILLFIVIELVRRRAFLRKEEVFVERMSGAQEASVVLPFATEATVLIEVALFLSIGCLFLLFLLFPILVPALGDPTTFGPLRSEIGRMLTIYGPILFFLEVILGPAVGFVGAFLGTRGQPLATLSTPR